MSDRLGSPHMPSPESSSESAISLTFPSRGVRLVHHPGYSLPEHRKFGDSSDGRTPAEVRLDFDPERPHELQIVSPGVRDETGAVHHDVHTASVRSFMAGLSGEVLNGGSGRARSLQDLQLGGARFGSLRPPGPSGRPWGTMGISLASQQVAPGVPDPRVSEVQLFVDRNRYASMANTIQAAIVERWGHDVLDETGNLDWARVPMPVADKTFGPSDMQAFTDAAMRIVGGDAPPSP